jgi:hypothetical protein
MKRQTSITVSGPLGDTIRALVDTFPGVNINRVGRAIIRLGLRAASEHPTALVAELRQIDSPWSPNSGACRAK